MILAFKETLLVADEQTPRRRRQRRCMPSLPESASCLEDRVLLSAAAGKSEAAEVARMAASPAGQKVTSLFESIVGTAPTGPQLTSWVDKLRHGASPTALKKDLKAQAKADAKAAAVAAATAPAPAAASVQASAAVDPITISAAPTAITISSGTTSTGTTSTGTTSTLTLASVASLPGLSAPTNSIVSPINITQVPAGMTISRTYTFAPTPTPTSTTTTTTATTATSTTATTLTSELDTLESQITSSTNTSADLASEISSVVTDVSKAGVSALTSPALYTVLDSLVTNSALTVPGPNVVPLAQTLLENGVLTGSGTLAINQTTLAPLLGTLESYASSLAPTITSST